MRAERSKCPVCGHEDDWFPYDICKVCGWERNPFQEDMVDEAGDVNRMSLNQARKAWKEGRKVE